MYLSVCLYNYFFLAEAISFVINAWISQYCFIQKNYDNVYSPGCLCGAWNDLSLAGSWRVLRQYIYTVWKKTLMKQSIQKNITTKRNNLDNDQNTDLLKAVELQLFVDTQCHRSRTSISTTTRSKDWGKDPFSLSGSRKYIWCPSNFFL